jgi:hypothetical protein
MNIQPSSPQIEVGDVLDLSTAPSRPDVADPGIGRWPRLPGGQAGSAW